MPDSDQLSSGQSDAKEGNAQKSDTSIYPGVFSSPRADEAAAEYLRDPAVRKLVAFFEQKGQETLAQEDRREQWYDDWLLHQAKHKLYAELLSPRHYSKTGGQFDLLRYARFLEVFAYYSPSHGYSLQVTFLGFFSILMGTNEDLKREAVEALEAGGLLAFGVSEQQHGSDLLANEFKVTPSGEGAYTANGTKYYIGNANAAVIISTLARLEQGGDPKGGGRARMPFIFFALRPQEKKGAWMERRIPTLGVRAAHVGEFEVRDRPLSHAEVVAEGRDAWEAAFGTVMLGKFFLGFGSIGICEHAFHEAADHLQGRILYGKPALDMPHLRSRMAQAYARLLAMKLYAYRALDYVHAASAEDRRYQLFCAVQKAKVSTEGVKVMSLISECVGAKGFEVGSFCEIALRDSMLIPGLEGSMHINLGLAMQFIQRYFQRGAGNLQPPPSLLAGETDSVENDYLTSARTGSVRKIQFPWFLNAFRGLSHVPNAIRFARQAAAFRRYVNRHAAGEQGPGDLQQTMALGQCFATIAYGQLVAENACRLRIPADLMSVIFSLLIMDLNTAVMQCLATHTLDERERAALSRVCSMPRTSDQQWQSVYRRFAQESHAFPAKTQ